jgi:hypothetical protein
VDLSSDDYLLSQTQYLSLASPMTSWQIEIKNIRNLPVSAEWHHHWPLSVKEMTAKIWWLLLGAGKGDCSIR